VFTDAGKTRLLQALLDMVVEVGWGTNGGPNATALTNPVYTTLISKRLEGNKAVFEYSLAWEGAGTRTLREVGLFTRDPSGNRVMVYRRTRDPVALEVGMSLVERLEVRLEDL